MIAIRVTKLAKLINADLSSLHEVLVGPVKRVLGVAEDGREELASVGGKLCVAVNRVRTCLLHCCKGLAGLPV